MISKEVCQKILELCLTTGGDFAEMFIEDTITNNLELTMGKMTKANTNHLHGVAIRILKGFQEVNGYTNDFSYESLEKLALHLRSSIEGENLNIAFTLQEEKTPVITKPQRYPSSLSNQDKVSYMMKTYEAAKAYSPEVSQILCNLVDEEQTILVANTLGKMVKDFRSHIRLGATVVAGSGTNMQSASDSIGGNQGYEVLDVANLKEFGENITSSAVTMVHADEMVGGKMTVVVHNAFGGVLLHEACVHALEATTVAKGSSVFCGKLGKKVASDIVTAIDDGTRFNQWGSLNIDD
ncbi:MAG: TldD/PmbA family protein, partial [Bacilli bacterium]